MAEIFPSLNGATYQLPLTARQVLAANMQDASTVEGAALNNTIVAIGDASYVAGLRVADSPLSVSITPANMYAKTGPRLVIPTYVTPDTGQATHPSVLYFTEKWNGYEYWMGFTPYPGGSNGSENPSVIASHDGVTWVVPAGLTNPIDLQPGVTVYNSDTELVLGPDKRLWLMWRTVDSTASTETLYLSKSADGVTWSAKVAVYSQPWATRRLLSPTLVFEDGAWTMWAVDLVPSPNTIVRLRSTGPDLVDNSSWGAPVVCTLSALPALREPWHIQVRKLGTQYVSLLCTTLTDTGGAVYTALVLQASPDGVAWSNTANSVVPMSQRGKHNRLYRSSFVPMFVDGEFVLRTWYSGILDSSTPPTWAIYLTDIHSSTVNSSAVQVAPGDPVPNWVPAGRTLMRLHAGATAEIRRNKATNPAPMVNATGWAGGYTGPSGVATPNAYTTGGPPLGSPARHQFTWTTAPTANATVYTTYGRAANDDIAVTPGQYLTFSAWIKPSWAGAFTAVRVLFYTSAGALIGGEVAGESFIHQAATWERRDLINTLVPATAVRAVVRIYSQTSTIAVGSTYETSSVLVEVTDPANPTIVKDYFDGAGFWDAGVAASWVGTAYASESILTSDHSYRQFWDGSTAWPV